MSISKLIKFYFHFHQIKSCSLCFNSTFIRHFQFSFKIIISFVISGLIAYASPLRSYLDQQYIICVVSVIATQETFGATLSSSVQSIMSLVPLAILLFLIQLFGLSYKNYLIAEILLLVLSFLIAYQCSQIQTRKIALLHNAIFFSTIVNERSLPKAFAFFLILLFFLGMLISVCVSLLIFPLFSTIDLENRFCYCLKNVQRMYFYLIQSFVCRDPINAKIFICRSTIVEQMIRQTSSIIPMRLIETQYEPTRFLHRIFLNRRKHLMNLNVQQQSNLINSLLIHLSSLQQIVGQCQMNSYHEKFASDLESSLFYLNSCQTSLIDSFISRKSISKQQFAYRLANLSKSIETVRLSYRNFYFNQLENLTETNEHLSHGFVFFQLFSIVDLLTNLIQNQPNPTKNSTNFSLKQYFTFQWSRLFLSLKSMMIIGVGSIFVMVPYLAKIFENGQWILIALCMTQADTVGGAFTTMKMRLIGTLLGAMWSYIIYLIVHDDLFQTFLMLIPWIFLFSYLRLYPKWGYTAAVASFTPILVNLGRLPFGDTIPGGNYALLRIEENLVGILIAAVLTLVIFPVYAIDLLKENIQSKITKKRSKKEREISQCVFLYLIESLECCHESVRSMNEVYDELFCHKHLSICLNNDNEIKSFLDKQRAKFQQLITCQRLFVVNASIEPTFFWFKNDFSSNRYDKIVQQQIDIFRILHNIDCALIRLSQCSIKTEDQLQLLIQIPTATTNEQPDLANIHKELFDLSQQINSCLDLWINYFQLTQTRCFQLTNGFRPHRTELNENDLYQHEKYLSQLNQTIYRLTNQHQLTIRLLFNYYFHKSNRINEQIDLILICLSTIYFSFTQLANASLALGTTIHEVFELETTNLYRVF